MGLQGVCEGERRPSVGGSSPAKLGVAIVGGGGDGRVAPLHPHMQRVNIRKISY